MEHLLTLAEVSKLVRAPEATLRYWRHVGSGPRSAKVGRRVVYRESEVQDWLDAQFSSPAGGSHAA